MGLNRPLRLRLLVMTCVTPAPTSPSAAVPGAKFGIAIGSGANSPSVMVTRFCANASRAGNAAAAPSAAIPESNCRRLGRNNLLRLIWSVMVTSACIKRASDRSFLEDRHEGLPFLVELRRQIIGLARDDRAQRALLIGAGIVGRRRTIRRRHRFQLAFLRQADIERHFRPLLLDAAIGLFP